MITVAEATSIIMENCFKPETITVRLTDAVGQILAEPIKADRDFPPFHRVTMDGVAIIHDAWKNGKRQFRIEGVQAAGQAPLVLQEDTNAIEVMTGAVLPAGANTVVRYEEVKISDGIAEIISENVTESQNIHRKGSDALCGELLLEEGIMISPAEIALLATVGKANVKVKLFPRTAIISTGDELVDIETSPDLHQIRRSNGYMLEACLKEIGCPSTQFHLADQEEILKFSLSKLLHDHDLLILSGGVSMGKYDFVPKVLMQLGVKQLFHQVSQRPGKPLWFGTTDSGKTVFALPGNPVSTFMCYHRYVKPWLYKSLGRNIVTNMVMLGRDFSFEPNLTYFLQVGIRNEGGKLVAYPIAGGGSGDFANLKQVDGFVELPMEKTSFIQGEAYPFIPFR